MEPWQAGLITAAGVAFLALIALFMISGQMNWERTFKATTAVLLGGCAIGLGLVLSYGAIELWSSVSW